VQPLCLCRNVGPVFGVHLGEALATIHLLPGGALAVPSSFNFLTRRFFSTWAKMAAIWIMASVI
jgi:hypothetical protein